jgi:hypothetical protein
MNLKNRVQRLESLLPQEVPWDQIYDAVVLMDVCTSGRSRNEAEAWLGDRENFINDMRTD